MPIACWRRLSWRSNPRSSRPSKARHRDLRERAFSLPLASTLERDFMTTATSTFPAITPTRIDFAKMGGLVPGIVQDAATGEILMLGFLNETSYQKSLESGFVTFWSRTRNSLWMKGETSGNRLRILSACHRLRQRRPPLQSRGRRRRPGLPRRHRQLLHQTYRP